MLYVAALMTRAITHASVIKLSFSHLNFLNQARVAFSRVRLVS